MDFISNAARPRPIEIRTALAEPSFSPIFAQLEAAVRYAHERCTHAETLQFGYVFKSARKEQYMVTMPLVRESFWKYEQVFPGGVFPQGYVLHGIYLCAATESLTPGNDPHDRMFHSPSDIDNGLRFIRFMAKVDALYLSCPDGALLRYQDSFRPEDVDSRTYFSTLRQQLREGKLTVLDYVRDLAGHGNLDVLLEGRVWAGTRRIKPAWTPGRGDGFFDYPMGCGPLFSHPDDAARYVQRQLSSRKGHNYVAAILASPDEASFISTLPLWPGLEGERLFRLFYSGTSGPVQPASPPVGKPVAYPDYPDVFRVVGAQLIYNDRAPVDDATSREQALTSHFIQPSFLGFFIRVLKAQKPVAANLYLAVRGGALLKYVPAFSTAEAQSTEVAADTNAIAFLNQLIGLGQLSVLDKDDYWNSEGLIRDAQSSVRDISQTDAPVTDEPLQVRDRDEL